MDFILVTVAALKFDINYLIKDCDLEQVNEVRWNLLKHMKEIYFHLQFQWLTCPI